MKPTVEPACEWRGDSIPDPKGSDEKPRRRSCDSGTPNTAGELAERFYTIRFDNMSQTNYDYVKINVFPETRRRLRVAKAERGVTYDELLNDLIDDD